MSHTLSEGQKATRRANMAAESRGRFAEVLLAEGRRVTARCWSCKHTAELDTDFLLSLCLAGRGREDLEQMSALTCSECRMNWPEIKVW